VHLVGFIIGIHHDARAHDRQKYHHNITVAFSVLCILFICNYITRIISFPPDIHAVISLWCSLSHFIRVILFVLILIYLLTSILSTPGGSSTVHI
jgi:uncharacterized membrane protein